MYVGWSFLMGVTHATSSLLYLVGVAYTVARAADPESRNQLWPVYGVRALQMLLMAYLTAWAIAQLEDQTRAHVEATAEDEAEAVGLQKVLELTLPDFLVHEIRQQEKGGGELARFAQGYPSASILFIEVADFSAISASMGAASTVEMLHAFYSALDGLLPAYVGRVTKLEQVSGEFMVAAGISVPTAEHAADLAEFAFKARAAVRAAGGLLSGIRLKVPTPFAFAFAHGRCRRCGPGRMTGQGCGELKADSIPPSPFPSLTDGHQLGAGDGGMHRRAAASIQMLRWCVAAQLEVHLPH